METCKFVLVHCAYLYQFFVLTNYELTGGKRKNPECYDRIQRPYVVRPTRDIYIYDVCVQNTNAQAKNFTDKSKTIGKTRADRKTIRTAVTHVYTRL